MFGDGMSDAQERLRRTARELIETDRLLGGDGLAPGTELPAPAGPAPTPAGANPAPKPPPRRAGGAQAPAGRIPPVVPKLTTAEAKRKSSELEAIDAGEVRACRKCGLCKGRTNTVFGEGHPDADIFFIGEGPGAEEDAQGRPFVGRAGELLSKMIAAMGLTRADVYIGNLVKCRPPGNREPGAEEVQACWDYLIRQLRIIRPKVIVTLGNPSTRALLNATTGITRLRGQWQSLPILDAELAGIKVMPTYHPAYVLRAYTRENRENVWSDLQEVMKEAGLAGK
jgi:DNA polymerase